ncbi:MAG TPA: type II secretion system protein [Thermoanaerobaculia bacterium]
MSEERHHPRDGGGEAGYNLVILVVAITVMSILLAAALPSWTQIIRREKEEELVFRGLQYAQAISLFHQRFQRYPNKLEELLEVKPRCIRQLWKDPMTEDGKWGLIFQNDPRSNLQGGQPEGNPNPNPGEGGEPQPGEENTENPDSRPGFGGPRKGDVVQVGPIVGVHSKSPKKSILIMFGRERYDEWRFTEDVVTPGRQGFQGNPSIGNPDPTALVNMSLRWVGRPMRFVNQVPGGNLPGGGEGEIPDPNGRRPNPRSGPRGGQQGENPPRNPR